MTTRILFCFNDTATTEIYTLSLHDALPIWSTRGCWSPAASTRRSTPASRSAWASSGPCSSAPPSATCGTSPRATSVSLLRSESSSERAPQRREPTASEHRSEERARSGASAEATRRQGTGEARSERAAEQRRSTVRVPIGWLAEHVDVPAGAPVEDLDTAFVRLGLEVEDVHRPAEVTGPLVVGRVLEIEELTGFKKPIRYCQVDVGEQQPRGIVCGATNFAVGDAVVVALPGAVLPGGFEIAARRTYDHVSDGMICSVRELGIGEDHAGILVLGDSATGTVPAPGTPAGPVVGLDDVVIELAVTPDRGYCLSMRGIAREMGTGLGVEWRDPGALTPPAWSGEPAWTVTVEDADRCDRFSMIALEGLDPTAPSPWWMRRRLAQSGVRSISLAVDVTNYVMLEVGQPMHAFDRDRVRGPIVVRRAREGERLTTLDGADRALSSDDLLITDDSGPIGLAAVMGGASTEIGSGTSSVLLEIGRAHV